MADDNYSANDMYKWKRCSEFMNSKMCKKDIKGIKMANYHCSTTDKNTSCTEFMYNRKQQIYAKWHEYNTGF